MAFIIIQYALFAFTYMANGAIIAIYLANFVYLEASLVGSIILLSALASRASRILAAPILNTLPSRHIMPLMCFSSAIGYAILAYGTSIPFICLGIFIIGFGYASNGMYVKAIVAQYKSDKNKSLLLRYSGLNIVFNIMSSIAPLYSTFIFNNHEPKYFFLTSSAILFTASILNYFFHRNKIHLLPQINLLSSISLHLKEKKLNILFIYTVLTWAIYAQFSIAMPLYVANSLHLFEWVGFLFTINAGVIIILSYPISIIMVRWNISSNSLLLLGTIFSLLGFLCIILGVNIFYMAGAVVLWTLAEIIMMPALAVLLAQIAPANSLTNLMAINSLALGIGEGLGGFIGSTTVLHFTQANNAHLAFIPISVVTIIFMLLLIYSKKIFTPIAQK